MNAVLKYLTFVGILAAASYAAATLDQKTGLRAGPAKKNLQIERVTPLPVLSGTPSHLLSGLQGQAVVDFDSVKNLTMAAAADTLKIWQLPEENPRIDFDTGDGFQVLAVKCIPVKGLLAVGGSSADGTAGGVRVFSVATGKMTLQLDEPEAIIALDLHAGGGYLLATARSYLKVIDIKDGTAVAVLPKDSPASLGYFYGSGSNVLLSASLALVDVNTQKKLADLDRVPPLLVRKSCTSSRFSWLAGDGLASQVTPDGKKEFFPLQTKGVIAFDIEPNGKWVLFLLEDQKLVEMDVSSGKVIKTVQLSSPATDIRINPDRSSAVVVYSSGEIAVFDIGSTNRVRDIRYKLAKALRAGSETLSRLFTSSTPR